MLSRRLALNSIRWRAALLTSTLVAVALAFLIAFTVRYFLADARQSAMDRSLVAATLLATQSGQSTQQGLRVVQETAGNPALRAFLESPNDTTRAAASALLERMAARWHMAAAIWDNTGSIVLTAAPGTLDPEATVNDVQPTGPGIAELQEGRGHVYQRAVANICGADEEHQLGYLVVGRAVDAAASSSLITGMVGHDARIFLGNQSGTVWTDLQRAVRPPSIDVSSSRPREFAGPNGDVLIGTPVKIPGTPLVVLLAFPRAGVVAPVWDLFRNLVVSGLVFVGLATMAAIVFSARVTRPLGDLTSAAQAIAAGDYARRVRTSGRDELARLGDAFNAMALQVEHARADLEARAEELTGSREEARRANAAKDEFLAVLSHELRTPLNAMLGWCQLLRLKAVPPHRVGHAVDVIDRNARAQLRLVNDLLNVSRIVVGRFTLQCAPVDAAAVVQTAVESIQPSAAQKGVSVHTTLVPDALLARADGGRLQQAIGNLLSNALKFTPAGGRIDVVLAHVGDGLEIVVRDTGEGIAADVLPVVFDRLHQTDEHAARRQSGLGLGLAIVRQVVVLHGGTVTAASRGPGTGATFRVWLPAAGAPDAVIAETPAVSVREPDAAASVQGVRCLVVDDSEDARDMVAALLTTRGAAVTAVDSAAAALLELDRELPDVIVSDLAMPGQSGFELILRIRARPAERGGAIPAVALTAYAAPEDRSRSIQAGFDEYLVKPVDASVLFDTVARLRRPA